MRRVEEAFEEIVTETVRRGGTITGEHGVGLAKKKYLPESVGALNIELMQNSSACSTRTGCLNPGKMFDKPLVKHASS